MKIATKCALAGALSLLGLSLAAPAGAAQDTKIYPGSVCKPATSAISYTLTSVNNYVAYTQNNGVRSGVVCPIVRDQVLGTSAASAYVRVYDPTTAGFAWCGLYAANDVAGTISYGQDSTTDAYLGVSTLVMETVTGSGWYDALTVKCNLDHNSKIYSFDIDETVQNY